MAPVRKLNLTYTVHDTPYPLLPTTPRPHVLLYVARQSHRHHCQVARRVDPAQHRQRPPQERILVAAVCSANRRKPLQNPPAQKSSGGCCKRHARFAGGLVLDVSNVDEGAALQGRTGDNESLQKER